VSELSAGTLITVAPLPAGPVEGAPGSLGELITAAQDCERVGAAVLALPAATTLASPGEIVAALRAHTGLIVQAEAGAGAGADLVAATPGEIVDGQMPVVYRVERAWQLDLVPADAARVELLLGGPGGLPGDTRTLVDALERLPGNAVVSVAGLGAASLPVLLGTLSTGSHVRVGMADTRAHAGGNAQLAARAAALARIAERPPLAPAEARALLM
jgi:uncharacterized protein (DUF849 family)